MSNAKQSSAQLKTVDWHSTYGSVGTIEEGSLADLVIVDEDPLMIFESSRPFKITDYERRCPLPRSNKHNPMLIVDC